MKCTRSRSTERTISYYFTFVKYNLGLLCSSVGRRVLPAGQSEPEEPHRSVVSCGASGFRAAHDRVVGRPCSSRRSRYEKRCLHAFGRHGKFAETATGCVSESVGQGSRSRWKRTFTRSQRRIAPTHQNNLDAGDLIRPIPSRDFPSVEGDLLLQTETYRLQDASFELIFRPIGIDDEADVCRYHDSGAGHQVPTIA